MLSSIFDDKTKNYINKIIIPIKIYLITILIIFSIMVFLMYKLNNNIKNFISIYDK